VHPSPSRRLVLSATLACALLPRAALAQAARRLKKRVAVSKFDAAGGFQAAYGGWDVGGGLAAQLSTALVETGQLIVVERADLAAVLGEQQLAATRITSEGTSAATGQVTGAQVLVRGSVTAFEEQAGGGGMRIGIGGQDVGAGLSTKTSKGVVGIDLRLIDSTTGRIVAAKAFKTELKSRGMSAEMLSRTGVTLGGDQFNKTVLGEATRKVIGEAAAWVAASLAEVAWAGRVSEVDGDQVFLNIGSDAGVREGDAFAISRVSRSITDPNSGELLGVVEEPIGQVRVLLVQEKFSVAGRESPFQAQRGDVARQAR
jgi:curli biogenesis system outer membrane secretion channel CsgG